MFRDCLIVVCVAATAAGRLSALAQSDSAGGDEINRLIDDLAASDYAARELARGRLEMLAGDRSRSEEVRGLIASAADEKTRDYEARLTLESLRRRFPIEREIARAPLSARQIDAWLADLDSGAFAVRDAAAARLQSAAGAPETAVLVLEQTQRYLAAGPKSLEAVKRAMQTWRTAWSLWLSTDAKTPPPIDDAAIAAAVELAVAPLTKADLQLAPEVRPHAVAERTLLLFLARDDTGPRTAAALQARLSDAALPLDAAARLATIYDWSRPAMVVEFWRESRLYQMQHLIVGQPYHGSGAPKPSHFDRCDDRLAHCVSGNAFKPGDWPVGVFMPHPSDPFSDLIFHIKNLPTARRRLAYDYEVPVRSTELEAARIDERRRAAITARTMEYFLQRKHDVNRLLRTEALSASEIAMLRFLDAKEVSRFVGRYLAAVDDARIPRDSPTAFGNGSSHGMFCYLISLIGTAEAGPGLTAAIDNRRVLDPVEETPYRMDWVSAFVLADRDPWPGLDEWLAKNLDRTDAINIREPESADAGASCAAMLLRRHGISTSSYWLEQNDFMELTDLENPGYRFTKPEGREAVKNWWREHKDQAARETVP